MTNGTTNQLTKPQVLLLCASLGLFPSGVTAQEITAEEVVSGAIEAMGGAERVANFTSLRFRVVDPDGSALSWEILRPNRVRKERPGRLILVFDGSRAGFLENRAEDGSQTGPYLVPEEDWHPFEMDIALYVPAFLEYPATYAGMGEFRGSEVHLLEVDLPMGGVVVYSIDSRTYRILEVHLPAWDYRITLDAFERVEGLVLPTRHSTGGNAAAVLLIQDLEVDVPLGKERFTLPVTIR